MLAYGLQRCPQNRYLPSVRPFRTLSAAFVILLLHEASIKCRYYLAAQQWGGSGWLFEFFFEAVLMFLRHMQRKCELGPN
jgi:hypothetical protein